MAIWWMEGGVFMWVVLFLSFVVFPLIGIPVVLAFVGRMRGGNLLKVARLFALGAVLLALIPTVTGLVGWLYGRSRVDSALEHVDPEHREMIEEVGYAEARRPVELGCGLTVPLFLLAFVALAVAMPPTRTFEDIE